MPTVDDIRQGPKREDLLSNGAFRRTCSAEAAARIEKVISALRRQQAFSRGDQVVEAEKKLESGKSDFWTRIKDRQNRI